MPRKKDKRSESTAKTKVPDLLESGLVRQPVKSVRARTGYVGG